MADRTPATLDQDPSYPTPGRSALVDESSDPKRQIAEAKAIVTRLLSKPPRQSRPLKVVDRPLLPENSIDVDTALIFAFEYKTNGLCGLMSTAMKMEGKIAAINGHISAQHYDVIVEEDQINFINTLAFMHHDVLAALLDGTLFWKKASDRVFASDIAIDHKLVDRPGMYVQAFVRAGDSSATDRATVLDQSFTHSVMTSTPQRSHSAHAGCGLTLNELLDVYHLATRYLPSQATPKSTEAELDQFFLMDNKYLPQQTMSREHYANGYRRYIKSDDEVKYTVFLAKLREAYIDRIQAIRAVDRHDENLNRPMRVSFYDIGYVTGDQGDVDHERPDTMFAWWQALVTHCLNIRPGEFVVDKLMCAVVPSSKADDALAHAKILLTSIPMLANGGILNFSPGNEPVLDASNFRKHTGNLASDRPDSPIRRTRHLREDRKKLLEAQELWNEGEHQKRLKEVEDEEAKIAVGCKIIEADIEELKEISRILRRND